MDFTPTLRECGLKSTPQRTAILTEIYKAGHIDIEKLHQAILKSIKIPLGTLYRALTELSSVGILTPVSVNGLKTHYELVKQAHGHFVCDKCGEIYDFEFDSSGVINNKELEKKYSINSVQLTAHGVCGNCKK